MKKQKDGYYHTRIVVNGETKSIKAKTLAELEEKRASLKRNIFHEDMSVSELCDKWLEAISITIKPSTLIDYTYGVNKIKDKIGLYPASNVRQSDIQNIVNTYHTQPQTLKKVVNVCKRIFEYGIDNDVVLKNPCRNLIVPKYIPPEKRALTEYEIEAIKNANLTKEERVFISLLYYTGIRRGEALALRRENIDYAHRRLKISRNLTFIGNHGQLSTPKTKTSVRTILMPTALYDVLSDYQYDDFLFSRNGTFMTLCAFRRMWESICKKANIDVTPHMFRHNYATMLYHSGVDIKEAQRLLGHASVEITLNIYTHLSEEFSKEVSDSLNSFDRI